MSSFEKRKPPRWRRGGHSDSADNCGNGAEFKRQPLNVQVVKMIPRSGSPPLFVPHRDPDPLLASLQDIQLAFEFLVDDAKMLVRLTELIDGARNLRVELAEVSCSYQQATKK